MCPLGWGYVPLSNMSKIYLRKEKKTIKEQTIFICVFWSDRMSSFEVDGKVKLVQAGRKISKLGSLLCCAAYFRAETGVCNL